MVLTFLIRRSYTTLETAHRCGPNFGVDVRRFLLAVLSVAVFVSHGRTISAQASSTYVRLRIQTSDGLPLSGALVAIVDDSNQVVAEGISSLSGIQMLKAPSGMYRLRVRRIGFRPFVSDPFSIPHEAEVLVTVETPRVVLNTVLVTAKVVCKGIGDEATQLHTVWEEIDKSLRSSQLSLYDISAVGWSQVYRKEIGPDGTVLSSDTSTVLLINQKPFGAPDPEFLARVGYVQGEEIKGWEYFGPDEAVLLSESFRRTHCFSVARDKARPEQIGIAFSPIPERDVPDISGTFWVNDTSSALTEVVFRYSNAGLLSRFRAGGFARFRRLSSGAVIVDSWELSAPRLEMRPAQHEQVVASGYTADGGMIISGARYDSLVKRPERGATIVGAVRDESGSPIGGAEIRLATGQPNAISDSLGRFQVTNLPAGTFVIHVRRLGFSAQDFPITLSTGQRRKVQLNLPDMVYQLSTVEVKAPNGNSKFEVFFSRRSQGLGTFVPRKEIEARSAFNTTQLLQSIPGLLVRQTGTQWVIQSRRCGSDPFSNTPPPPPLVFVDGFMAQDGAGALDAIKPNEIEAIEVYQGVAQLPAEARGKGCAAIFLWLRQAN